jgi:hypothetical protein
LQQCPTYLALVLQRVGQRRDPEAVHSVDVRVLVVEQGLPAHATHVGSGVTGVE